jgi:hypothetical protein
MFETLGENREFLFNITSIANQPCLNYGIDATALLNSNNVTLIIKEIIQPSHCMEGLGPAFTENNVGILKNGTYKLSVKLKDVFENKGELFVRDDEYQMKMGTKDGLEILFPVLKRIPVKTIWGYLGYDNKLAVGNLPNNFLSDLSKISQDSGLKSGNYGHFTVDKSLNLVFDTPPVNQNVQTFKFYYEGAVASLQNLLDNYSKASGGENLKIKIFTWDGHVL